MESGYTSTPDVEVEAQINGLLNNCSPLNKKSRDCFFVTATNTTYNVTVKLNNSIGTELSNPVSFNCKLQ